MKTKRLFLCLLFLVLGTTAWADKYYQPGSYRGNTTPRLTLEQAVGKKFMIYNTAIAGNVDRTGFLRNNGVQFEHDKTKERDLFIYNESFVYTMEKYTDENGDYYAIKSVQTGLYVNINGKTDVANAADAKLYITDWDNATNKSGVNMENWKYNIIANGQITSSGNGSTVFVVKNGNTYWNGNTESFATYSDGHPFAFYIANEVTGGDYLEDLHIYSRCDIYSAQVIYGLVQSPSQITTNHPYDEGEIANLLDGDGVSYHVSDWMENNADDYHYYQVDLGKGVESLYLYMQRRADGKNAPTKYELQVCATPDGQFVTVGGERETNLANSNVYASDKIDLGGSYRYIRIVAKERTVKEDGNFMCMGLSELYVLPGTQEIKDAIDYITLANEAPIYTRATERVYREIVEEFNTTCPAAKLLSGVPLPGNKYRIYADAFDTENGVYVNREIMAGSEGLLIENPGTYNASDADGKKQHEWYCELTADGYLTFRNVGNMDLYLGNGVVTNEPYKWSMSTIGTQRHGVPLMNFAMQYLALANDGTYWMGNVRQPQDQTVAPAYVDGDNDPATDAEVVPTGLCTDFVFIPVLLENNEKKITITGNALVKRNTRLLFDANNDGEKEALPLPYARMFVSEEKFSTLELQLLCNDIHTFKGVKVNDEEVLNKEIAELNGNVVTFDFTKVKSGDVLNIQLEIKKPFDVMNGDEDVKEKSHLYLIRNKRQYGLPQQARPNRADANIGIGGDDKPISSQTGKMYYAKFNQRDANMLLLEGSPEIDELSTDDLTNKLVEGLDASSLFYFTKTEDKATDEYYSVNIQNVTTVMKCADQAMWNSNGNTWFVQPKTTDNYSGYNIGRTKLGATNNPNDAWCSNHDDGNKILVFEANDDGTAWEFVPVSDGAAKKLLKDFIDKVAGELNTTLDAKKEIAGIDKERVEYYRFVANEMKARAERYFEGEDVNGTGENPISKLLQFAQNIHMLEHEIQYALFELPELSTDVVKVLSQLDNSKQPHWYYIRNVKGTADTGKDCYAAFNGDGNPMALQQYAANEGKKLVNMFYFVGEKNSYESVANPDYDGTDSYADYPGNNLIIDEYLKAHVHNFAAKEVTLVSRNVLQTEIKDYFPGVGQQTVVSNLDLKANEDWCVELEYDLAGNTSFNAYGSCLLASSGEPLADSYAKGFQVYLKDDRSLVVKCGNNDDRYRFWHTQDYFSHIKVVITYSQKKVTVDVYNSLGEKETKTMTGVTMDNIDKLSSALPATGATIASLATYKVETMTWKEHSETINKDEWYILPSSNTTYPGFAIVLEEPNDANMGWANDQGGNTYVATDLGTADNSTWIFERVTDFDAHVDELIGTYDFKDCVIYDKELAKLFGVISKNEAAIKADVSGVGEEALFNELYYAFLNYKGLTADELKAPKPGSLYTIRSLVEAETENALLVHTDWTNDTHASKEVYLDDVVLSDNSFDSRAVWVFEGTPDGNFLALDGLKVKNLHTQCYITALGANASSVNEEDAALVTLEKLGACTTMFQVGDKYMNRTTSTDAVRYIMNSGFWGSAITEYPADITTIVGALRAGNVHKKSFNVLVDTEGTVSITLTHERNVGQHKLNILGANLVDLNGKIAAGVYRHGTAGGNPETQTYELANVKPGAYTLNCYVWNYDGTTGDDDKVQNAQGSITFSGISQISGAAKITNDGTATTKWIIEEIKDPENSVYFNVPSLSAGTQPDTKAYASLYLGFDAKIPDGITAWIVTGVLPNTQLVMEEVDGGGIVPANTGLILSSESPKTNQKFYYSSTSSKFVASGNMLTGTAYTKVVDCTNQNVYMLGKKNDRIALYWTYENRRENGEKYSVNGTTNHNEGGYVMCNANKSYLEDVAENENAVSVFGFSFRGGATDIDEVKGESGEVKAIYDLAGRRLVKVTSPGIYIVDGKKVYVTEIED